MTDTDGVIRAVSRLLSRVARLKGERRARRRRARQTFDYTGYDHPRSAHLAYGIAWGPGELEAFLAAGHRSTRNVRADIDSRAEGGQKCE